MGVILGESGDRLGERMRKKKLRSRLPRLSLGLRHLFPAESKPREVFPQAVRVIRALSFLEGFREECPARF